MRIIDGFLYTRQPYRTSVQELKQEDDGTIILTVTDLNEDRVRMVRIIPPDHPAHPLLADLLESVYPCPDQPSPRVCDGAESPRILAPR